jgi:hypothetical protein
MPPAEAPSTSRRKVPASEEQAVSALSFPLRPGPHGHETEERISDRNGDGLPVLAAVKADRVRKREES